MLSLQFSEISFACHMYWYPCSSIYMMLYYPPNNPARWVLLGFWEKVEAIEGQAFRLNSIALDNIPLKKIKLFSLYFSYIKCCSFFGVCWKLKKLLTTENSQGFKNCWVFPLFSLQLKHILLTTTSLPEVFLCDFKCVFCWHATYCI